MPTQEKAETSPLNAETPMSSGLTLRPDDAQAWVTDDPKHPSWGAPAGPVSPGRGEAPTAALTPAPARSRRTG